MKLAELIPGVLFIVYTVYLFINGLRNMRDDVRQDLRRQELKRRKWNERRNGRK